MMADKVETVTRADLADSYAANASSLLTQATKQVNTNGGTVNTLTELARVHAALALEQRLAHLCDILESDWRSS